MKNTNYMLSFGSLRQHSKRGYNFQRFGGQEYIETIVLDGYEMFDLGSYPTVCVGNGLITCELHSVSDDAWKRICSMEKGAGYQEKIVKVGDIDATIFVWDKAEIERYNLPKVANGNWD